MAPKISAFALATACVVSILPVTPAAAAAAAPPVTSASPSWAAFGQSRFNPAAAEADWRCRGWRCGYYRRHHHYDDDLDVGDVLIGAAIIGGIAAIISASSKQDNERDDTRVEREDARRYDSRSTPTRSRAAIGLDSAVDQCLVRVERNARVDRVDAVDRTASGWRVSGTLLTGSGFTCRIGNDGAIEAIDYGSGALRAPTATEGRYAGGQWSDQSYADARLALGRATPAGIAARPAEPLVPLTAERVAAYPGGPIPGEVIPETIDGDL